MALPTENLTWAESGTTNEPSVGRKATGWLVSDRPPASQLNWWKRGVARWVAWLQGRVAAIGSAQGFREASAWANWTFPEDAGAQKGIWSNELQLFVVVGQTGSNRVLTSPDGITWTARVANEQNNWVSVAYAPTLSLLAAVSTNGTNRVMTSPDGTTWTPRAAAEANTWNCVIWVPELAKFVAVASSGTNRVMTSTNGTTWTAQAAAAAQSWQWVAWSAELGLLVAVSSDGTNRVMTSPDGTTWTLQAAATAVSWKSVCWSNELSKFVAVGTGSATIMTSTNGVTWVTGTISGAQNWEQVIWVSGLNVFVAVASSGTNKISMSADGVTWYGRASANEGQSWRGIVWADTHGALITLDNTYLGRSGNRITSTDQIIGVQTTNNAVAGFLGELMRIARTRAAATGLTSGTAINVGTTASLTLTPGDWNVYGYVGFTPAATTNVTQLNCAIATTSATMPADATILTVTSNEIKNRWTQAAAVPNGDMTLPLPMTQIKVGEGTTLVIYLVASGVFTVSTLAAYGYMEARRSR